nr:unnamed protein product [Callosobruchus chinensis]
MSLDDHILKKHPDFISFVSRKIHQCTICFYKTVVKSTFDNHMSTHPEATPRYELSRCVHCNATFKRKESLEDHVLKKHPEFFTSGTKKVHECTNCTYKTLIKYHLDKHIASIHHLELRLCVHCGTTFKTKTSLDDHIVKIHPDYITTVTSKLHECSKCTYKTTIKQDYNKHILVHPETASCFDVFRCPHCEVTFRRKESLDDHVLKNHPDFFTSHTKKVYECTGCSFRTTMKKNFYRHMSSLVHLSSSKLRTCIYCEVTLRSKRAMDDHVVRKLPNLARSIGRKIECPYKTVQKNYLERHTPTHFETGSINTRGHCEAIFESKRSLDDHVVKKHLSFGTLITSKIHVCMKCGYRSVSKGYFDKHNLIHHDGAPTYKREIPCVY